MIDVRCQCGTRFKLPDEWGGRQGACPRCRQPIDIPAAGACVSDFDEVDVVEVIDAPDVDVKRDVDVNRAAAPQRAAPPIAPAHASDSRPPSPESVPTIPEDDLPPVQSRLASHERPAPPPDMSMPSKSAVDSSSAAKKSVAPKTKPKSPAASPPDCDASTSTSESAESKPRTDAALADTTSFHDAPQNPAVAKPERFKVSRQKRGPAPAPIDLSNESFPLPIGNETNGDAPDSLDVCKGPLDVSADPLSMSADPFLDSAAPFPAAPPHEPTSPPVDLANEPMAPPIIGAPSSSESLPSGASSRPSGSFRGSVLSAAARSRQTAARGRTSKRNRLWILMGVFGAAAVLLIAIVGAAAWSLVNAPDEVAQGGPENHGEAANNQPGEPNGLESPFDPAPEPQRPSSTNPPINRSTDSVGPNGANANNNSAHNSGETDPTSSSSTQLDTDDQENVDAAAVDSVPADSGAREPSGVGPISPIDGTGETPGAVSPTNGSGAEASIEATSTPPIPHGGKPPLGLSGVSREYDDMHCQRIQHQFGVRVPAGATVLEVNGETLPIAEVERLARATSPYLILPPGTHQVRFRPRERPVQIEIKEPFVETYQAMRTFFAAGGETRVDELLSRSARAMDVHRAPFLLSLHGGAYAADEQWKAAERKFRRSLQVNPLFAPAHLNLAYVMLRSGDRDGAKRELMLADALNVGNVYGLAPAIVAMRTELKLTLDESTPTELDAAGYRSVEPLSADDERMTALLEAISKYAVADGERAKVLNNLGVHFADSGKPERALEHFREALEAAKFAGAERFELAEHVLDHMSRACRRANFAEADEYDQMKNSVLP